jgi:hypothetical protein
MLALLALGVLDDTESFPKNELSVDAIDAIRWVAPSSRPFYKEMIGPLYESGHGDFAAAIEQKLRHCEQPEPKKTKTLLYEAVRRADRKYLSGRLRQLKRRLSV